jgi:hypothetical protein
MDIPAISSVMAQANLMSDASIEVAKMVKGTMEQNGSQLIDLMETTSASLEQSVQPHIGSHIDIRL